MNAPYVHRMRHIGDAEIGLYDGKRIAVTIERLLGPAAEIDIAGGVPTRVSGGRIVRQADGTAMVRVTGAGEVVLDFT